MFRLIGKTRFHPGYRTCHPRLSVARHWGFSPLHHNQSSYREHIRACVACQAHRATQLEWLGQLVSERVFV